MKGKKEGVPSFVLISFLRLGEGEMSRHSSGIVIFLLYHFLNLHKSVVPSLNMPDVALD